MPEKVFVCIIVQRPSLIQSSSSPLHSLSSFCLLVFRREFLNFSLIRFSVRSVSSSLCEWTLVQFRWCGSLCLCNDCHKRLLLMVDDLVVVWLSLSTMIFFLHFFFAHLHGNRDLNTASRKDWDFCVSFDDFVLYGTSINHFTCEAIPDHSFENTTSMTISTKYCTSVV